MADVAPTAAQAPPTDALDWLDDPANFTDDNPASRETYRDAPAAPALPAAAPEVLSKEAAEPGDKTAREALTEQLAKDQPAAAEEPGYTQDEQGRWHTPDGTFATAEEVTAIEAVLNEGKPDAAPKAADAKPVAPKQPIGDVQVFDAEGKPVDGLPALAVTYQANGKALEKVPLDKLIRKAQLGEYNEQREQESLANRQRAEEASAAIAQLQQAVKQYESFFERALADERFYQSARQQHEMVNTPEARLAVRERELQAIEQQRQDAYTRQQSEAFVAQHIAPRINALATSIPQDDVTQSAFYGKVAALTAPYLVNGRVPPDRLPEVVRIIDGALTPWAESLVQSRAAVETKEKTELRQQVTAAKVALALAKKQQQRALAPQGRAGALREKPAALPPPKSADESNERMFAQIEREYGSS